jgi:hypothetical protein
MALAMKQTPEIRGQTQEEIRDLPQAEIGDQSQGDTVKHWKY